MRNTTLAIVFATAVLIARGAAAAPDAEWDMLKAKPEVVEAWRNMRFGMFLCWGPVTLTGEEIGWSRGPARPDQKQGGKGPTPVEVYDQLYKKWKPEKFDARAWVKVAQDAGAGYMIFLVKHHDGFCLYDTKLTEYRSTGPESAWKVDVLKAVADACHAADLKLIVYYSQPDWHHPDYRTANHARYIQYLHGQIREILINYGRIDGLWFDLGGTPQDWDSEKLFKMARQLQPWLIINNRCGLPGDYDTPEQRIGGFRTNRPWESCITLGTQWSWKPNDRIKSLKECIDTLVRCAGGDGNLALNVDPTPDGDIEPGRTARFREIGQWLSRCGRTIYGTRGGPFKPGVWGASTHKENSIYVHVLNWPDDALVLPPISAKIVSGKLLTSGEVQVSQDDQRITLNVAKPARDILDTIIELQLDSPADRIPPCALASGSLTTHKPVRASSVWPSPGYGPEMAVDDDEMTRWGAAADARSGWLEVDLGAAVTIDRVAIKEAYNRVQEFGVQYKDGETWRTCLSGTTIGPDYSKPFTQVTARVIRLNILKATDVPTIWEFQVFAAGR